MPEMLVCVTGASGFIGHSLVVKLLLCGYKVRVLTRHTNLYFGQGAEVFFGDLTSETCQLNLFVAGCQVLIHCAGEIREVSLMRRLHIVGTQRLLDAVVSEAKENERRIHWVQLSSVGVYGPTKPRANMDRTVTETTPVRPVGVYETTKAVSDQLVVQASEDSWVTYSILRPSNVFGPKMPNQSLHGLIHMLQRGLFFYFGRPGAVATFIHVDDVVAALFKCAFEPKAQGQIYNLSYDCLLEELVCQISVSLGVNTPWLRVPEILVRMAVGFFGKGFKIPLTRSRVDALVSRTRYPVDKIENELGFQFSKPMPMSIADLVLLGVARNDAAI